MNRWIGKVAVIIGASSGIGAGILEALLKNNQKVVGLARQSDKIKAIRDKYPKEIQERFFIIKCDVRNEINVKEAFEWIQKNLGGTDLLIYSAGILSIGNLISSNSSEPAKQTLDTNVLGALYSTREAYQQMKARKINGHIVIINSLSGHAVPVLPPSVPMLTMYPASKYAVTAMIETFRQEFLRDGSRIKLTSISPGAVHTNLLSELPIENLCALNVSDVVEAVLYALSTPEHVLVKDIFLDSIPEDTSMFKSTV